MDEEEESKKIASAFTEVKQGSVYRDRKMTIAQQRMQVRPNVSILQFGAAGNSNDDNQSIMADMAQDCETNRVNNDNFRLDMTWAE